MTWNNEITTQFFLNGIASMKGKEHDAAYHSIQLFKESMSVKILATKRQGGYKKPKFNVYANGNFINDTGTWLSIRAYLHERSYCNSKFGQGLNIIASHHCGLCHGVNHPRGICLFPKLEGWMGLVETDLIPERMERNPCNSGRFPPGPQY